MGNTGTKHQHEGAEPATLDEGHFNPLGVYPNAPQDWDIAVVHRLIKERRISPFYKGLPDADDALAEHTTGTSPPRSESFLSSVPSLTARKSLGDESTVSAPSSPSSPTGSRASFSSKRFGHERQRSTSSLSNVSLHKGKRASHADLRLSFIKPSELYKNPIECPICFLYYPRNINYSRCCEQPICTECFVHIKRPESTMDPAACPFCVEGNFGIVYYAPNSSEFRAKYGDLSAHADAMSVRSLPLSETTSMSSIPAVGTPGTEDTSSLSIPTPTSPVVSGRRRSVSHKDASVVTTDEIRPDGVKKQQQVALARAVNERRAVHPLAGASRRRNNLFNISALDADTQRELASAAAAAATLVEGFAGTDGGSRRRNRREARQNGEMAFGYLDAVRNIGTDLEELMIMEAMRRSLLESTNSTNEQQNGEAPATGSTSSGPSAGEASPSSATSDATPQTTDTPTVQVGEERKTINGQDVSQVPVVASDGGGARGSQ
ncbi:SNF1-interacting protein [Rhizophlyctis rosea]|uniref:SNF1-interacting protein n=1 Tax=Rhizophlyctis rosea TaxID=64517 RepID=A0AAD5SL25_9FUNG|nr:SNF1-interacting protein [Rhizophlyctis rosea]